MNNLLVQLNKAAIDKIVNKETDAFRQSLESTRLSQSSQFTQLPSSKLLYKHCILSQDQEQLFVVLDTCSIIRFRAQFMNYVTKCKLNFISNMCPIKFIISLPVLEELDQCKKLEKKTKKAKVLTKPQAAPNPPKQPLDRSNLEHINISQRLDRTLNLLNDINEDKKLDEEPMTHNKQQQSNNGDAMITSVLQMPTMFSRFVEEEMRLSEILISEFDPPTRMTLQTTSQNECKLMDSSYSGLGKQVVVKQDNDERVLDCCLRAWSYIKNRPHHKDTKLLLVTEDSLLKSRATTYNIVSFRWLEFCAKFKNFGFKHYTTTPTPIPANVCLEATSGDYHQSSFRSSNSSSSSGVELICID